MLLTAAAFPLAVKHMENGDRRGALLQISLNGVLLFGVAGDGRPSRSRNRIVNLLIAENFRSPPP